MSLQLLPDVPRVILRKRGRPVVADRPGHREEHLACLGLFVLTDWPAKRIAGSLLIAVNTAYRWARWASRYPEATELLARAEAHPRRFIRELARELD